MKLQASHADKAISYRLTLAVDVGRVLSDQSGTTRVDRVYWSNTRIVKDVPGEVSLQPNLWGRFTFGD